MVNIDALLSEWAYRCEKGYPDMDSPSDLRVLKSILKEQGISLPEFHEQVIVEEEEKGPSKKELIDLINKSDLNSKVIKKLFKVIKGSGIRPQFKDYLTQQGYTSDSFKNGEADIDRILNVLTNTEADELLAYMKNPKKLSDLPIRGNLSTETGLSKELSQDLIQIVGVDKTGSNIGKLEIFLALVFSDVNNRSGGGDLNWEGVGNLEIKGTDGRLGQQSGRGNYVNGQNRLADKFVPEGDEREEFESSPENQYMNFCLQNAYNIATKNNVDISEFIDFVQKLMDEIFFDKGLAKKYFNSADDFKDLAKMRNSIFKLNVESYAKKTNVDAFMFATSATGEYAIIDVDNVNEAIDNGIIKVAVDPKKGYFWHNPNPNVKLGKK